MTKSIILKSDGIARLDDHKPFYLPSADDLTLTFSNSSFDLSAAFIRLKNGNKSKVYPFCNVFTVPQEFCDEGILSVTVYTQADGKVLNTWSVFPIKIQYALLPEHVYGEKMIYDYIAALEERIVALEKKLPKSIF